LATSTSDNIQLSEPSANLWQPHPTAPTEDLVTRYLRAARAPNTQRAYDFDRADFRAWGGQLPSSADEVARYLADRASLLKPSSLRRRLAALAILHRDAGYPDPTKAILVRRVMQGIERTHGTKVDQVAPLVIGELAQVTAILGTSRNGVRDRAILLVGFFGALRRSEIVALNVASLTHRGGDIDLWLERSKTDQTARGRSVHLATREDALCPVRSLRDWLTTRGLAPGPLFCSASSYPTQKRLSGRSIATIVRKRTWAAGLCDKRYSGHSLRAGYATSAALAGLDITFIARQTGHRTQHSLSAYVRPDQRSIPNFPIATADPTDQLQSETLDYGG